MKNPEAPAVKREAEGCGPWKKRLTVHSNCSRMRIDMGRYLLIGAGFSRNWGGPLSEEITGSLLGDLHDDIEIANALRRGPFEDAFQGFQPPSATHSVDAKLIRFQEAVSGLFLRLNKSLRTKNF